MVKKIYNFLIESNTSLFKLQSPSHSILHSRKDFFLKEKNLVLLSLKTGMHVFLPKVKSIV